MIHTDRIAKRSLDSPDHPLAATSAELLEAADMEEADTAAVQQAAAAAAAAASVVHDNSTSRTFVALHIFSDSHNPVRDINTSTASIQCRLARSERSFPTSGY